MEYQPQNTMVNGGSTQKLDERQKHILIIVLLIVLIVGVGIWYYYKMHRKVDPLEELTTLKESSLPVTATNEERAKELDTLKKSSTPVPKNTDTRMRDLESLGR